MYTYNTFHYKFARQKWRDKKKEREREKKEMIYIKKKFMSSFL